MGLWARPKWNVFENAESREKNKEISTICQIIESGMKGFQGVQRKLCFRFSVEAQSFLYTEKDEETATEETNKQTNTVVEEKDGQGRQEKRERAKKRNLSRDSSLNIQKPLRNNEKNKKRKRREKEGIWMY